MDILCPLLVEVNHAAYLTYFECESFSVPHLVGAPKSYLNGLALFVIGLGGGICLVTAWLSRHFNRSLAGYISFGKKLNIAV